MGGQGSGGCVCSTNGGKKKEKTLRSQKINKNQLSEIKYAKATPLKRKAYGKNLVKVELSSVKRARDIYENTDGIGTVEYDLEKSIVMFKNSYNELLKKS
jgi:hypothetical protein